ncbi:MAG: hypothetical protein H6Q67_1393 [Firmicutes bacterium]|nr:hypothetical protein [Bacillota bacterium]
MHEIPVLENIAALPAWLRLESQIIWYADKSGYNKKCYKVLKFLQITLAISIPVISHVDMAITKWIISIAGALIAIFESVQYMNRYEALWILHRSTAERLKREKFLFLSAAGPYKGLGERERLICLAEQVEENVAIEQAVWINERS